MASGRVPKMVRTFSIVWSWDHALVSVEAGLGKGDSQWQADVTQADACTEPRDLSKGPVERKSSEIIR